MPKAMPDEIPVVWLQGAGCTGCSVSVLNSVSPSIKNVLIDEVIPGKHINLRFHPNVMAGQGDAVIEVLRETQQHKGGYVLVVEGAIPTAQGGIFGTLAIFSGIGGASGAWFAGFIYDQFGSYLPAFIILIVSAIFASQSLWWAAPRKIRAVPGKGCKKM